MEKPRAAAVVHIPRTRCVNTAQAVGNRRADEEAKRVATTVGNSGSKEEQAVRIATIDSPIAERLTLQSQPSYISEDLEWI